MWVTKKLIKLIYNIYNIYIYIYTILNYYNITSIRVKENILFKQYSMYNDPTFDFYIIL